MKRPVPMKVAAAAREMGANLSAWRRMQGLSSEEVAQRAASRAPPSPGSREL